MAIPILDETAQSYFHTSALRMNPLSSIIAGEIAESGPISFARFMELALYCPNYGYYERQPDNIGQRGDFQTSVTVGPLFGGLLAFRMSGWLDTLSACHDPLRLVEAGAHDGQLALDVLDWFTGQRPDLLNRLQYTIVEPSSARRAWQQQTLKPHASRVSWHPTLPCLIRTTGRVRGVLFSNELLDAFPVRRFAWNKDAGQWFEWQVAGTETGFFFVSGVPFTAEEASVELGWIPGELLPHLPDGHVVETSPGALHWWREAAESLEAGWLLALDYGFDDTGALQPERPQGTLRAYHRHRVSDDILANPGQQDLTAHVNFSRIAATGERAGLATEHFETQGRFLSRVWQEAVGSAWGASLSDARLTRQFRTLIHPDHFGHLFQVLVQQRPPSTTNR